jgi:GTP-binding protein
MWFVDRAEITLKAGDGGRGCSSFAQPPYTRSPYPDGGDGGDGGDIIIRADGNMATLLDFHFRHKFASGRGQHGGSNTKTGKRGASLVIRVPVGTLIHNAKTQEVLRDLTRAGDEIIVAKGGRGGFGNASRAKRANTVAADAKEGMPGEQRCLLLELKLIADVGIIGCPNAGKSSLLARISTARPKIGAYPFTTRYPVLGVVSVEGCGSLVACDIPGLIEGAHEGKGLGIQFLRHIERTRVLVHLVDMASVDGRDPLEALCQVKSELAAYSEALSLKPQLIAANKMDLPQASARLEAFTKTVRQPVWPISCATGEGVSELLQAIWKELQSVKPVEPVQRANGPTGSTG